MIVTGSRHRKTAFKQNDRSASKMSSSVEEKSMSGNVLVAAQFALTALLIWPWSAVVWPLPALAVFLPGAAIGLWTLAFNRPGNFNIRPEPKPDTKLVLDGPYAYVRHPMYVSVLLMGLAAVLFYLSWLKMLCLAALYVVLWIKSGVEEEALRQRFPGYRDYALMVGRFFPKITVG
jgi:protein-S-isoprenylcysteine O-methyltransferase Ste14